MLHMKCFVHNFAKLIILIISFTYLPPPTLKLGLGVPEFLDSGTIKYKLLIIPHFWSFQNSIFKTNNVKYAYMFDS